MTTVSPEPSPGEVIRLLASGVDLEAAANRLGISVQEASALLSEATQGFDTNTERAVEAAHLDLLRRAMLTKVMAESDTQAAWTLVSIHQARAALLGLTSGGLSVAGQPNELAEIRARRAARRSGLEDGGL